MRFLQFISNLSTDLQPGCMSSFHPKIYFLFQFCKSIYSCHHDCKRTIFKKSSILYTKCQHNISVVQVLKVQEGSISLLPTILNNQIIRNSKRDSFAKNQVGFVLFQLFWFEGPRVNCHAFLEPNSTQPSILRDPTIKICYTPEGALRGGVP